MAKSNLNFGKAKPGYDAKTVSEVFDELLSSYETAEKAHRDLEAQIITLQAELTDVQNQVSRNVSPNYSALGNAFEQVLSEAEKVDRNLRSNAASKSKQDLQNARSLSEQTLLEARRSVASLQANSQADVETLRVDTERKISELNGQTENIDRTAAAELEQAERSSSRAITEAEVEVAQFTQELHKELEQVRNELLELRAKHQYENLQALYELKVNEEVQGHARLERSESASEDFRAASDAANAKIAAGVDQARASQQNAEQYLKDRRAEAADLLQNTREQSAEMLREAFSLADTLINRAEEISRSVQISSESVNAELVKQIGLIQDLKNEIKSFATPEAIVSIEESNAHDKVTTDKQLAEV
jgi:cell division septum initiation protein DivIVA